MSDVRDLMELAAVFKDGMETQFWKELERMLDNLRQEAVDNLMETPPAEIGLIAEYQAIAKVCRKLKLVMLDTIQEAEQAKQ